MVFTTQNTETNIHSHYTACEGYALSSLIYTGKMRVNTANGGVGVTFLSDYVYSNKYHRLRRHQWSPSFHFSPTTDVNVPTGDIDTGVIPQANAWYRFTILVTQVEDPSPRTRMQAKVWLDGTTEPASWQADCYDEGGTYDLLTEGTFGVWSMGPGQKYWDDLEIQPVD